MSRKNLLVERTVFQPIINNVLIRYVVATSIPRALPSGPPSPPQSYILSQPWATAEIEEMARQTAEHKRYRAECWRRYSLAERLADLQWKTKLID